MKRICPVCGNPVHGRRDKIFCTVKCKSEYHRMVHEEADSVSKKTDKILHRNYIILFEEMKGYEKQAKVPRINLDRKNFNYNYYTGTYINSRGKTYYYVYDYGWMPFSDQEILIIKRS